VHAAECSGVLQWSDAVDFEGDGLPLRVGIGMSGLDVEQSVRIVIVSSISSADWPVLNTSVPITPSLE
jgi:hypothetical protein